ncbi:MAG: 4-(cytidine 5'-diphospho)-2-C-methyl-D-erythritol kinase [Alphaproteobacteria bacterium]|nr:4-(cytidine 5'-diphospho)-2-C-methyl-D-erythritol kinase [Alphaproteobacteria bacterium]
MIATRGANLTTAWAPAKVNLYLHVGPPGPGGLHPLDSLVVFADTRAADRVSARPHPQLSLTVEGPGAKGLRHAPNNLTLAAAHALREACAHTGLGAVLTLHKELPIAGGVGGGSADAAAALHVLNDLWNIDFGEAALEHLGNQLGSDVPACVRGRPLLMRGTGERLIDVASPDLPAVLVNPGVTLETRRVFERFDQMGVDRPFREAASPATIDLRSFVSLLEGYRNDLQAAAVALCAEIQRALVVIREEKGCLLARMSGSGPTCFGIFDSNEAAEAAAESIAARKRKYWVRATTLRGAPPMPVGEED